MADQFNTLDNIAVGITDGTLSATIRDAGANDALNVAIVDGSGNQITSFSGGTQYAEDTSSGAGDLITMAGVVRKNTQASLVDTDGDRTQLQVDTAGALWVNGSAYSQPITNTPISNIDTNLGAKADAAAGTDTGTFSLIALVKRLLQSLTLIVANERNSAATVLTSGARTITTTSADQSNLSAQGAHIIIDVTATAGTVALTPSIQGKDDLSGKWYDLLVGKAISAIGTTVIKIHPGLPGTKNISADDGLPLTWRCVVTVGNADSTTYSVGVNYLE